MFKIYFSVSNNNHTEDNIKQNECFLIPSQVSLNESDIKNWNHNKVIKKPKNNKIILIFCFELII